MSSAQYVAQMDKPMTVYVSSNVMLARRGKKLYKSQMELVLNQVTTALKGTCVQMIHIVAMKENVTIHGDAHAVRAVNVQAIDSQGTFTIMTQMFA